MLVLLQSNMSSPPKTVSNIGYLAVYDDNEELLAVMWRNEDGSTAMTRAGETDFGRLVQQMGLDKRSEVRCIRI